MRVYTGLSLNISHINTTTMNPFIFHSSETSIKNLTFETIPGTLIADSAAAALMKAGHVDAVVVGADRVASNGTLSYNENKL